MEKQKRRRCIKCDAVRNQEHMEIAKQNPQRSFWQCVDCDSNRKAQSLVFNGIAYSALLITYHP